MSSTKPFEYRIPFSEDYPKLAFPLFPTIRLERGTTYYSIKRIYTIYVQTVKKGFAMLVSKYFMKLGELPQALIRFDTYPTVTFNDFYRKMVQFHAKTSQWQGLNTLMLILYLLWIERL